MRDMKAIPLAAIATLCAALLGCAVGEGLSRLTAHPEPEVHEPATKAVADANSSSPIAEHAAAMTETVAAVAPATAPDNAEALARGKKVYSTACITCHAAEGGGVPHMGTDITVSTMVKARDVKAIAEVVRAGRAKDDPANKSGLAMPAKGMNPMMKDRQIEDVAAYVATMGAK